MDMDMEGGNTEGKGESWSIYRDAFTPTSLSHANIKPKPKPWERAPVSAHAPRLAGQKIWKKASSLHSASSHAIADKENAVQVELELEKGGVGARKRRRGVGGKENIGEAKFMSVNPEGLERAVDGSGDSSPRKNGALLRDEDAFVVPRKRTNANHLITPRKALRHVENNIVAPALEETIKSPAKGMKIPLNDNEGGEHEKEKPRRRKSMRKSRRLTRSDLVEETVESRRGSFVFGQNGGDGGVDSFSGIMVPAEQTGIQAEETLAASEESSDMRDSSSILEQAVVAAPVVEGTEIPEAVSYEPAPDAIDTPNPPAVPVLETVETLENETSLTEEPVFVQEIQETVESELETSSRTEFSNSVNENLEKQSGLETIVELTTIEDQPIQAAAESSSILATAAESVEIKTITAQLPQTPIKPSQLQLAPLQSVEPNMAVVLSPTKSLATPRSRRKTPQRSATRRSTRTTRNSSMSREEPSTPAVPALEGTALETLGEVSRFVDAEHHLMGSSAYVDIVAPLLEVRQASDHENGADDMSTAPVVSQGEEPMPNNAVNNVQTTERVEIVADPQPEEGDVSIGDFIDETSTSMKFEKQEDKEGHSEQDSCDEQLRQEIEIATPKRANLPAQSLSFDSDPVEEAPSEEISEESAESFELIEPNSISASDNAPCSPTDEASEELHESSTPDLTTTELTETISENAPSAVYDHDDTDMLRNFLSKVKANKAAKAKTSIPKRKRSLPHSPLQIPLGTVDATSPSPPKAKDEFDVSLPTPSPSKRRKRNEPSHEAPQDEDVTEPRSIRRSGRTRLPVKAAPVAPSFIPVRRLGQDGDSTVTLRRNEEKELAALTKVNTRKNKGGASHPADFLAKKADEKEDPASRQRALKEVFDEKNYKQKLNKKGKSVVWAEELAQFQTEEGKKVVVAPVVPEKEGKKEGKKVTIVEKEPEREKEKPILPGDEKKSTSSTPKVKVGIRSKMTLGMAANGTPAPKRRVRGRS
ncbi:hypothetical protein DL95DRAFT_362354 [Leptodontidium sp. 2 PMI_412]|nr:hypothetical protein DL95DRAFT_362354 [Leptodontidium sp. 2 PMI_412]